MILCTCEKPSVAKDIAKVLGANKYQNGYYEGNGYLVTWAPIATATRGGPGSRQN